jgi:hypothetical protein
MLRSILDRWQKERSGAARLGMRSEINTYCQRQKLEVLEQEIMSLDSIRELRILQGAGIHGIVYDMMYKRRLSLLGFLASAPGSLANLGEDAQEQRL